MLEGDDICQAAQIWLTIHQRLNNQQAFRNVRTQLQLEKIGDEWLPATLNQTDYDNSYVCSPYTAYISYAKQELPLLKNPLWETLAKLGLGLASIWLKGIQINRTLSINNWLFSTKLPGDWSAENLHDSTQNWIARYPTHSISIRSLNPLHHPALIKRLNSQNWLLMPARQVFVFDGRQPDWWRRNNCKNDQRLLRKTPLQYVSNEQFCESDFPQVERCYNQLFIEKHSNFNPQLTAEYCLQLHRSGLVNFQGFRDETGRIIGVVGFFTQRNIITSPILGYDTQQPKSLGLYRLLITLILKQTHQSAMAMNLSSGAGEFKAMRGGEATVEYTAYYVQHLPTVRRWGFKAFNLVLNQTLPKLFSKRYF